ncbi:S8 family serine peptidase [Lagierella sp.]|uniref:S8 family serine peptidase n=1 Tax=Lagierella sp. TaxID=2849657 RepID=UPI002630A103|nr:S8 family serine peptidase [Lagierella sp.]
MKRWLAFFLAIVLSLSLVNPVSATENLEDKQVSDARRALEFQARGRFSKDDQVDLVVEVNDKYFSEYGKIIDAKLIREGNNQEKQIAFARKANTKALELLKNEGIKFNLLYEVEVIMVGFTGTASYGDALKMTDLPFIKSVSIAQKYNLPEISIKQRADDIRMITSRKMVGTDRLGLTEDGRGTVIAVLDSGFDKSHPSFYLKQEGKNSMKLKSSSDIILRGVKVGGWVNEKIPFGYNYADKNNIIANPGEAHGQHVAGTAIANETEIEIGGEKFPFKGIAPEAQLLAMRVFSSGGGTSPQIYIPAMDDAVKLGADAINMSLGSPAGENSIVDGMGITDAIDRANEIGCVVAMAAGNEGQFGRNIQNPKAYNPDFGVVGSPSVANNGLSVANLENDKVVKKYGTLIMYDALGKLVDKLPVTGVFGTNIYSETKNLELVVLSNDRNANKNINYTGKAILVDIGAVNRSGEIVDQAYIRELAKNNPALIIFYASNTDITEYITTFFDPILSIPVIGIKNSMVEDIKNNQNGFFAFTANESYVTSMDKGNISTSSSWGVSADGEIKPDILAPGGKIYSTVYNQGYEEMTGTSMATPHVAGGIAIVRSRVNRDFPSLTGFEKSRLIRNLVMSTAKPHKDLETEALTSPRWQGAGLMDLVGATNSEIVLYDANTKETKVNLGDVGESFDVSFVAKNLGSTPKSFKVTGYLTTDYVYEDSIVLKPRSLGEFDGGVVKVDGKSEKEITVKVDSSKYTGELEGQMENGYFLDGHIILEAIDSTSPNLTIPFLGFKGNFKKLDLVEPSIYDLVEKNRLPFYYGNDYRLANGVFKNNFTHFRSTISGNQVLVGQMPNYNPSTPEFTKIAISPNGDGKMDNAELVFTLLRNTNDLKGKLYKSNDGKKGDLVTNIFQVGKQSLSKNHNVYEEDPMAYWGGLFGSSQADFFNFKPFRGQFPDGEYIYELSGKPASGVEETNYLMKFYIDTVKPAGKNPTLENGIFNFEAVDELTDIIAVRVLVNGKEVNKTDVGYEVPSYISLKDITVEITDSAYNTAVITADQMPIDDPVELKKQLISIGLFSKYSVTVTSSDEVGLVSIYKGKEVDEGNLLIIDEKQGTLNLRPFNLKRGDLLTFVIKADGYEDVITTRKVRR